MAEFIAHWGNILGYILFVVAFVLAVGMPLFTALTQNPKSLVQGGIAIGALLLVFAISYVLADGSDYNTNKVSIKFGFTESGYRMVSALMIMTYALFFVAVAGVAIGLVKNLLKK